jgi:hypothetical protein
MNSGLIFEIFAAALSDVRIQEKNKKLDSFVAALLSMTKAGGVVEPAIVVVTRSSRFP